MFEKLTKFNFGSKFKQWIRILYNKPNMIIKNNGWLSDNIEMKRGIRQGCPLSALLFIIAVEILAIKIRTSKKIEGFELMSNGRRRKVNISQYADDAHIFLKNPEYILNVISEIQEFGLVSGLLLNLSKTKALLIGKSRKTNINITFITSHIICLGNDKMIMSEMIKPNVSTITGS